MRSTFVVLLLSLGLGGVLLVKSRHTEEPAASSVPPPQSTAAASPKVSEHNWPKNSLDRVGDLKRQVAEHRKENDAN